MALLLILFALFAFLGIGSSSTSSGSSSSGSGSASSSAVTSSSSCVVVTWQNGKPAHRHSCRSTSSGSVRVHVRTIVKCSAHMSAGGQTTRHCSSPPANP